MGCAKEGPQMIPLSSTQIRQVAALLVDDRSLVQLQGEEL